MQENAPENERGGSPANAGTQSEECSAMEAKSQSQIGKKSY